MAPLSTLRDLLAGLLVGTCLAASAGQAPVPSLLAQRVEAYSTKPALGPATSVRNWTLPLGRMTLQASSGSVVPLLSGGQVLGFYFSGSATFRLEARDPLEWAALTSNFKENVATHYAKARLADADGHKVLTEEVKSFTLWFAGTDLLLPSGGPADSPTEPFGKDWAYFGRDGLGDRAQDFAAHLANTPKKKHLRAEIVGQFSSYVYTLDEGASQLESLWAVADPARPALYNGLRRVLLSQQPLGWTWPEPLSPLLSLTAVDIDLRAGLGGADLRVTETLVAGDEGMAVLALDLHSVLDPQNNLGIYRVSRVLDAAGKALPFHHRHDRLLVQLERPQPAGRPFQLTFEYGGRILLRPGGDNYWELGVEPWFPMPAMDGQAYTVHALIRTHKDDVAVACGRTIRRSSGPEGNLLEVSIDKPVQFFSILAGAYSFTEDSKDGLTIRVATYGGKGGSQVSQILNLTRQTIDLYQQMFEAFPFPEFNVVQVNTWGYGQAPPGMMIITNEAFNGKMDDISSLFTRGINQRIAHEIAHQYWGHLVKMPSEEEQWLTESFANYSSALALRVMKNQGTSAYEGLLSGWRNQASSYADLGTIPFANRLNWIRDPRATYIARTSLLYEKGGLLLAALHKEMGDRAFAVFMKSIIANFRWKTVTTKSVEQLAAMAAKKDFSPLFRDCYWGTRMPK